MRAAQTIIILACLAQTTLAVAQRTRIGNIETIPNAAMLPPQVISSTAPSYTSDALVNRIEGTVTIEAEADINGSIKVLRVVKGLGHGLDETAVLALRSWIFAPARRNGAPVAAITQIDIDFRLPQPAVFRVGGGVIPPTVVARVEPQYTEEARKARYIGTVVVEGLVKADGTLDVIRIVRGLDYGLTENAVDALKQWKFNPAIRNGKPAAVSLNIEVNFNLGRDKK